VAGTDPKNLYRPLRIAFHSGGKRTIALDFGDGRVRCYIVDDRKMCRILWRFYSEMNAHAVRCDEIRDNLAVTLAVNTSTLSSIYSIES
jgi:hypothetical protein